MAKQRIMPGVYDDGQGGLHIVVSELLRGHGYEDNATNRATFYKATRELLRERYPTTKIIEDDGP